MAGKTNIEFLTNVMEVSSTGGMMQAFISDSILKAAINTANLTDESLKSDAWKGSIVDPIQWRNAAREYIVKYNENYDANVKTPWLD